MRPIVNIWNRPIDISPISVTSRPHFRVPFKTLRTYSERECNSVRIRLCDSTSEISLPTSCSQDTPVKKYDFIKIENIHQGLNS